MQTIARVDIVQERDIGDDGDAQPQIPILATHAVELRIKVADALDRLAAEHRGRAAHVLAAQEEHAKRVGVQAVPVARGAAEGIAVDVDPLDVGMHQGNLAAAVQLRNAVGKVVRQPDVVRVEQCEAGAARDRQGGIARVAKPLVGLVMHAHEPWVTARIVLGDRAAGVAGTVVDDDDLEVAHRLCQRAIERLGKKTLAVVDGYDRADERPGHGSTCAPMRRSAA